MIRLIRLYSQPNVFKEIKFHDGVNIILGEKVEESAIETRRDRKTNGVGKSMSIEFINFCLLTDTASSRVVKIPLDVFPADTKISLDLSINEQRLTISRSKGEPDNPTICLNGENNFFNNVKDARDFLLQILFNNGYSELLSSTLSFRQFIAPIIRDEDSEFKNILYTHDVNLRIPHTDLIKPHLYYLGISIPLFDNIVEIYKELTQLKLQKKMLESSLTQGRTKKMSEVKSELNEMNAQVTKIKASIDSLRSNDAYILVQDDLNTIELKLNSLHNKQKGIRYELQNIESFPDFENIDSEEIELIYNRYKAGLGDHMGKSLEEVQKFKRKIDDFQRSILKVKIEQLRKELRVVTNDIRTLEDNRADKIKLISSNGELSDYLNSQSVFQNLLKKHSKLMSDLDSFDSVERDITKIELMKDAEFMKIESMMFELRGIFQSLTNTILDIHYYIMGNKTASFDVKINKNKTKILEFEYRIYSDGSRSVDRTKVFIYDIALMFNPDIEKRHPHLLIHDNIFDVDQDTLVRSLNYLAEQERKNTDFQYILTLNRDKIENEEHRNEIELDIEGHKVAQFTKRDPFLSVEYQEIE